MSLTGEPDGRPTKVGVAIVDVLTGLHAVVGILAALRERDRTGVGQHVEVNLLSSVLASLVNQASGYLNGAGVPGRLGNRHPSIAVYETVEASDGPLALAVGNDRQFARLCAAIGRPDLLADERFTRNADRVAHRSTLVAELEQTLRAGTVSHWIRLLTEAGVPCGPVNDLDGAFALAEQLGLSPVVSLDGIATVANPIRFSRTPVEHVSPPPTLGADDAEIRAWLAHAT
jgi:crotonobetainyl-CoA:carnitine CoA-transferase CaiB-like acyl-CoA transferase